MTNPTQTVRRRADISRADALKGLVAKFPDHDIVSFKEEMAEFTSASGTKTEKNWVAELVKSGGFEDAGGIPPEESEAPADVDSDDPTPEAPAEDDGADVEVKVDSDKEEGGSEKDMLHDILDLLREMVEGPAGEGAPHGELGPEGPPSALPGDPGISQLPAAVKPSNGMENMQDGHRPAFAHMANKRHFFVEADAPGQSLKAAVKELNAALAPTHRVAKIQRKGAKIVAGVTRVPGV